LVTGDPGGEWAAGDVLVVVLHQDAVVSGQHWQVGHGACAVLVVQTADVRLGWTLDGQRQTTWSREESYEQTGQRIVVLVSFHAFLMYEKCIKLLIVFIAG